MCFIAPPSPPQNLQVLSVTSRSVTLEWMPPSSDGGSEITGKEIVISQLVLSFIYNCYFQDTS